MKHEATLYLATRLLIYGGLVAIGVAAGSKVGLNMLESVCAVHGPSGTLIVDGEASVCTKAAVKLATIVNTGAYAGAAGLLLGGGLDSYREEVIAWIQ